MFSSDIGSVRLVTDMEAMKTNEVLRRRKLRLLQVREQSKDIAKKVRQRAKSEQSRSLLNLDPKKEKEYLVRQEKLVRQLEELYAQGLQNIGESHRTANLVKDQENIPPNPDLVKIRAREAASLLRQEKEKKLLAQKTLLVRKAQAREAANEISREKLKSTNKQVHIKIPETKVTEEANKLAQSETNPESNKVEVGSQATGADIDMGTQWDFKELPQEWEPSIPKLTLSNTETEGNNESGDTNVANKQQRNKNLFALSDEMPSSLRGGINNTSSKDTIPTSKITLVSEHLQNRSMRLREPDAHPKARKPPEDLQSIKETIMKARAAKREARQTFVPRKININLTESTLSKNQDSSASKTNAVTVYNHSTRDHGAVPFAQTAHVIREVPTEDAFSQAIRESNTEERDKEHDNKLKDMRHKIAMTKQSVEKEYRDTMSFLNSMPKEVRTGKIVKKAYMDDDRLQTLRDNQQRRMQYEYKEIEKECRRKSSMRPTTKRTKSPIIEDPEAADFQYSWMPVPEDDASMAVHTIPVTLKEGKNSVKFSKVDSYHEYRSRHKHTPPTKDTPRDEDSKSFDTMVADIRGTDSSDSSESSQSDHSVRTKLLKHPKNNRDMSDAEKIIIYKIIESKTERIKRKKCSKKMRSEKAESADGGGDKGESLDKSSSTNLKTSENPSEDINKNAEKTGTTASTSFALEPKESNQNVQQHPECPSEKPRDQEQQDEAVSFFRLELKDSTKSSRHDVVSAEAKEPPSTQAPPSVNSVQPTACSSSSSFQTAALVNEEQHLQDGVMKLVDKSGKDFYIGTTGFLKDDKYEVIIQLRKKDSAKTEEADKASTKAETAVPKHDNLPKPVETNASGSNGYETPRKSYALRHAGISNDDKGVENIPTSNIDATPQGPKRSEPVETPNQKAHQQHDSQQQTAKPVASTFTQTTGSPVHVPLLFHMSSSTSTAYMSPPDVIIPKYYGAHPWNYVVNGVGEQVGFEMPSRKLRRKQSKLSNILSVDSDTSKLKGSSSSVRTKKCSKKRKSKQKVKKDKSEVFKEKSKVKPCRCRKCITPKPNKTQPLTKRFSHKHIYSTSKDLKKRTNSVSLNPIVREYVNKLLALNKECLRVVDVANQDCSSVTTPGSSIINIGSNLDIHQRTQSITNNKILLKQISETLIKQHNDHQRHNKKRNVALNDKVTKTTDSEIESVVIKILPRLLSRKTIHKVKALNISKKLCNSNSINESQDDAPTCSKYLKSNTIKPRSKSSPTPRYYEDIDCEEFDVLNYTDPVDRSNKKTKKKDEVSREPCMKSSTNVYVKDKEDFHNILDIDLPKHSQEQTKNQYSLSKNSILTQTEENVVMNKKKSPENKEKDMKIITHLTEKCTRRLSDLAKILNEVRKYKSLAYSHISSDHSSDSAELRNERSAGDIHSDQGQARTSQEFSEGAILPGSTSQSEVETNTNFLPVLDGIPKPSLSPRMSSSTPPSKSSGDDSYLSSDQIIKLRNRPPTALARINLKHGRELNVPHELSTVVEVDSPMSLRMKSITNENNDDMCLNTDRKNISLSKENREKILASIIRLNSSSNEPPTIPENSKMKIMDLEQFNEIMLKPFITIEEFAKQCHLSTNDIEDTQNEEPPKHTTDNNSARSEGSLPDVIGELLKRKVISEPFQFETACNANSTTLTSESSVSVFAMSKTHINKPNPQKPQLFREKPDNIAETSDSLSISSNPDLENAFKKLGMRWASSTLKKTKERLALSSSSNSSSSSSQNRVKLGNKLQSEKTSQEPDSSVKVNKSVDAPRAIQQQTVVTNNMTVKEFLTQELAKKITFSNKSIRNDSEEFVSVFDANMSGRPNTPPNQTIDSERNTNRARTSTPVQIYKSQVYHSSSSSNTNNTSNGLFSNVDDLSSVKVTSSSIRNNSGSDKDDLTIPNYSLKLKRNSEFSRSE